MKEEAAADIGVEEIEEADIITTTEVVLIHLMTKSEIKKLQKSTPLSIKLKRDHQLQIKSITIMEIGHATMNAEIKEEETVEDIIEIADNMKAMKTSLMRIGENLNPNSITSLSLKYHLPSNPLHLLKSVL